MQAQRLDAEGAVGHCGLLSRQLSRALAGNHARIDAGPVQPAEQPPVLDLDAAILHDVEPGGARAFGGRGVGHAELHPQALRADRDRIVGQWPDVVGPPEAVDHVDRPGRLRGRAHIGITGLSENLAVLRVHRDHRVAVLEQVLADEVARPMPFRGDADDRNATAVVQQTAQGRDVGVDQPWRSTVEASRAILGVVAAASEDAAAGA